MEKEGKIGILVDFQRAITFYSKLIIEKMNSHWKFV